MNRSEGQKSIKNRGGRDTLRSLLRRPGVVLLLGGTALAQAVIVNLQGVQSDSLVFRIRESVFGMTPTLVAPDSATIAANRAKAVIANAARLAEDYRNRGFGVTPKLAEQIAMAAHEYDIDPEIAFGLVRAESSFRNQATSRVGAVGLTQVMPRTARWVEPGVTGLQLRDPETNLRIGFKYLRYLLDKYEGNERLALLAYNRGPGTVDSAIRRGRNPDNGYADFVVGMADHGHELFTR